MIIYRTKDRILYEALKLFSSKGIKETTVRDIAKAVGITEGAIYRHFKSKDEIVNKLFAHYSEELYNVLREAVSQDTDFKTKFRALVDSFIDYILNKPDVFRYLDIVHLLGKANLEDTDKLPMRAVYSLIEEGIKEGYIKEDTRYASAVLVGTIDRIFVYKTMDILRDDIEVIKEKTFNILWNCLVECGK
jgi:AcrR family transcriptional regulator